MSTSRETLAPTDTFARRHTGDNAALAAHTGAPIAVHPLDAHRLTDPKR